MANGEDNFKDEVKITVRDAVQAYLDGTPGQFGEGKEGTFWWMDHPRKVEFKPSENGVLEIEILGRTFHILVTEKPIGRPEGAKNKNPSQKDASQTLVHG